MEPSILQTACGVLLASVVVLLALVARHLPLLSVLDRALLSDLIVQHPSPLARHPVSGSLTLNPLAFDVFEDGERRHAYGATREELNADRLYVITGSSSGIGLALAQKLEGLVGADRVVYAVRSPKKVLDFFEKNGRSQSTRHVMRLDLNSLQSVLDFTLNFSRDLRRGRFPLLGPTHVGRRVVLVNNAGVSWHPERRLTGDGLEEQFQSNVLGHYLLTRVLLEQGLLCHVVHTSSVAYHMGKVPSFEVFGGGELEWAKRVATDFHVNKYSDTKFMNVLFSNSLARRFPNVSSVAVHPGMVATDILKEIGLATTALHLVSSLSRALILPPDEAANTMLYAIFPCSGVQGGYVSDMRLWPMNPRALDEGTQDYTWILKLKEVQDVAALLPAHLCLGRRILWEHC